MLVERVGRRPLGSQPSVSNGPSTAIRRLGIIGLEHLNDILTSKMTFDAVENFPSLWFNSASKVLVAAYVDDVICAGNGAAVREFWKVLQKHVNVDGVTVPGKIFWEGTMLSQKW